VRYIPNKQLRRLVSLDALEKARKELARLTANNRNAFIDANQSKASDLRSKLWMLGGAKCWYSEACLLEGEGNVEHYRPKKRLSGCKHGGYWWRAFDWTNLRLAHSVVNRRMTDFLTRAKAGKGSYFPLRDESTRATSPTGENSEEPVLLDPTKPADPLLIAFNEDSGKPEPRYKPDENEWLNRRATQSIEYYHLDEGTWNGARHDLIIEVQALCKKVEEVAVQTPRDEQTYMDLLGELINYINPWAEFSSACIQTIRSRGILEKIVPGLSS
jgi:hypothetical protein